jgi:glucokinase
VADVARITADAVELIERTGLALSEIERVGVSAPGPIDRARGTLLHPPNLPGWEEVPLRDWIGEALGRPVLLENDANAAALAEWRFGAGRGAHNLVYLTMSTGVGAGLILEGRVYRGHRGHAGEVGHIPVEWGGKRCACGQQGCLEAYVGGAAWTRHLRELTPPESRVFELAGDRARILPEHLVAAAGEGDAFALGEMDRFNDYLARGIVALTFTLAPEVIVLGTIPTAAGEALCFEPVRRQVSERLWPTLGQALRLVPAGLGEDLPYYAGVCVARENSEIPDR